MAINWKFIYILCISNFELNVSSDSITKPVAFLVSESISSDQPTLFFFLVTQ